jgi:hypothetical protein
MHFCSVRPNVDSYVVTCNRCGWLATVDTAAAAERFATHHENDTDRERAAAHRRADQATP